jgi:hypothetical protein
VISWEGFFYLRSNQQAADKTRHHATTQQQADFFRIESGAF